MIKLVIISSIIITACFGDPSVDFDDFPKHTKEQIMMIDAQCSGYRTFKYQSLSGMRVYKYWDILPEAQKLCEYASAMIVKFNTGGILVLNTNGLK